MIATNRVVNSVGETVGFIVDDQYMGYYTVLDGVDLIDNLCCENNKVKELNALDTISMNDVNKQTLRKLCEKNPFVRGYTE